MTSKNNVSVPNKIRFNKDGKTAILECKHGDDIIPVLVDVNMLWAITAVKNAWAAAITGITQQGRYRAGDRDCFYILTNSGGNTIYLHRLLMIASGKTLGEDSVDHISGRLLDCRLSNLQCVTQAQNIQKARLSNRHMRTNTSTGVRNVRLSKSGRYSVRVLNISRGTYATIEEAEQVAIRVRKEVNIQRTGRE